jgi:hypothetical protein
VRKGWKKYGTGHKSFLANEVPYAAFLYNDDQSRMAKLGGWKTLTIIMKERAAQIIRIANSAAIKAIRKLNL